MERLIKDFEHADVAVGVRGGCGVVDEVGHPFEEFVGAFGVGGCEEVGERCILNHQISLFGTTVRSVRAQPVQYRRFWLPVRLELRASR